MPEHDEPLKVVGSLPHGFDGALLQAVLVSDGVVDAAAAGQVIHRRRGLNFEGPNLKCSRISAHIGHERRTL